MCVILVAEDGRPTTAMLKACERANPDGGGSAHIEGGRVHWRKDLGIGDILHFVKEAPLPFVVHFRIATQGGVCAELCHPFPVDAESDVHALEGVDDTVVFHNGTWSQEKWKDYVWRSLTGVGKKPAQMPAGPWSDTRAIAFLMARHGSSCVELMPVSNRLAVVTSKGVARHGEDWHRAADGIWASNMRWNGGPRLVQRGGLLMKSEVD